MVKSGWNYDDDRRTPDTTYKEDKTKLQNFHKYEQMSGLKVFNPVHICNPPVLIRCHALLSISHTGKVWGVGPSLGRGMEGPATAGGSKAKTCLNIAVYPPQDNTSWY